MAYSTSFPPALVAQRVRATYGSVWYYRSSDPFETVAGDDYFTNGVDLGMQVGDVVHVVSSTTGINRTSTVTALSRGVTGSATVAGGTQALTATAAVNPGIGKLTLAHASVVIAATLADLSYHQGIFQVFNTSASGTAAHTVTLTTGTWNGTNKVLTSNTPGQKLTISVDGSGNGTILENTGTVTFSG